MATQKRSSSGKRTTTGKKTTAGGKRTAAPKKRPIRREVGGVVCLVLALCIAFSYFQQGGWLLDRPAALCRGLVGYGYYTVAPVLLLVSYILLFHRGRNVTACVVGAALLPVLLGAMLHLVLCKTDYNSVDVIAKLLWQSGLSMESGGVLSATLAIMLVKLVKKTLAMILLAVLLVTCLMLAFRLTPAAVLEAVRSHERVPYEPEDDEEEAPPTRATATKSAEKSKACIDIPLDGETREPPKKEGKLSGFFTHGSGGRERSRSRAGADLHGGRRRASHRDGSRARSHTCRAGRIRRSRSGVCCARSQCVRKALRTGGGRRRGREGRR